MPMSSDGSHHQTKGRHHEEEKIHRRIINQDGMDGSENEDGGLLVLDDDDEGRGGGAEEAMETNHYFSIPQTVQAPPVGIRPSQQHQHSSPSSVQALRPLSDSPVVGHLKNKGSLPSSSFLSPSPPLKSKEGSSTGPPGPTIVFDEKVTPSDNGDGYPNHSDENSHESSHPQPTSSVSIVVCGVDGTVYTLDAYTGQLRGMFASGPALVFSSSPDEDTKEHTAGDDEHNMDGGQGGGGIPWNDHLNADANSAITSRVVPGYKERYVPGLDGKLYSLLEMVDEANVDENDGFDDCSDSGGYDDLDSCGSRSSESAASILPRAGSYRLTPLPISVMDVVDSPISTCTPEGDAEQEHCGIIVGSKKTTIYAIDPATGKVRWTQDPNGGGGGRGFTAHPPKKSSSRGKTVLLQREDYAVRHLDTDGGYEVWKVELGQFSALDFDVDRGSSRGSSGTDMNSDSEDDILGGGGEAAHAAASRRGAAAAAASVSPKDKKKGVPPILGGRKTTPLHDFKAGFHDEDDFDHYLFRGFPSVSFGEEGTSIMAVDGISGELLWKRRIESVVAAAYGVGKESEWIHLDVIDHVPSTEPGYNVGLLQVPSPHSGGLISYGAKDMESEKLHQLSRHHSSLFVKPKFDPLGGYDAHSLGEPAEDDNSFLPQLGNEIHPLTNDRVFTVHPSGMAVADEKSPPSQVLDSGLYLTWSMVAAVVMILLALVIVGARFVIIRQKRKLENTPSLDPATAPSLSGDRGEQSPSSGGIILPPAARNLTRPSTGNIWSKNPYAPVTRSFSLDALGSNSYGSPSILEAKSFISEKDVARPPPRDMKIHATPKPSLGRGISTPSTPTTVTPTITRSKTLPPEDSPDDQNNQQRPRGPSVDNIDGVPLVRYSRYKSEFQVISPLGSGGFGTVFRCENTLDGRHYAIKKIKIISQLSADGTVTKHFSQKLHRVLREVKILALLDHPNIVRYYTAWLESNDSTQHEDDDTTANSMLDRKSHGFFSSSLFSGFASNSRAIQTSFGPQRNIHQRPTKGFNPLGWNNFGSFRLDESTSEASSSFGGQKAATPFVEPSEEDDDFGFTWERSKEVAIGHSMNEEKQTSRMMKEDTVKKEGSQSSSGISSVDSKESLEENADAKLGAVKLLEPKKVVCEKKIMEERHILYIQMQLCSVQTLADFLSNRQARCGSISQSLKQNTSYAVDIPFALRLFAQITNGVKYVHHQGLIHRDLKPQNCFIDDAGIVKVGDFGLSRESSTAGDITDFEEKDQEKTDNESNSALLDSVHAENTAGVGTRAYASPEQMRGSNYDASTDVYSLGIMLFELCYPMCTAMERYKEFSGIKNGSFPSYWSAHVRPTFPRMHDLLVQMISDSPTDRPSADDVSDHIDSLLREYSVQSLDKSWGKEGALLLRVEVEEKEGILAHAMKLIKQSAPKAKILQYGLRGQASRAIMEFAIEMEDSDRPSLVETITTCLHENDMTVRQISNHY